VEQLTMNAWEWIEILNWSDYSAMRWPCPEWFHIFQYSEQIDLQEMMVTLWIDSNPIDYLKIPLTGYRNSWSSWEVVHSGASTVFWSVDSAWWRLQTIHTMFIQSDRMRTNNVSNRWAGNVIRPIKDVPVIPNNTWITLFDWSSIATGAWVYHSPELWLISISDDWQNRITIADKNLGATVVYENGDTLSDANCGNLYQWWNNYGFTHDWTVTTSYNKIDTTWYGPWNYYYGTTFILTNLSTEDKGDWSEEINDNLWWGVTGVQNLHNVITNTGVLSVNWKKWHVIIADNTKTFYLQDTQDTSTAQDILDWYLAGKNPIVFIASGPYTAESKWAYIVDKYRSDAIAWCLWLDSVERIKYNNNNTGTTWTYSTYIRINYTNSTVTTIEQNTMYLTEQFLATSVNYTHPYTPQYNWSPATKIYVDQYGPCVPVYHLGGGDVMTSYINFDMAGWTYKVKIQWYHGTTVNRTITVTASSAVAWTFTSNLIEHYNYGCIVTIDPSVSTTMIIQIDSHTNFTVDDIYIEKINIQSWIVTATSIN
jgi:hypothetical protein